MKCMHLIKRKDEVVQCSLKGTYLLIDKESREIVETFCTTHAEKLIYNPNMYELYYTRNERLSCGSNN